MSAASSMPSILTSIGSPALPAVFLTGEVPMPITSAMFYGSSVVNSLSCPTMLLSVHSTTLPAVSSTMSLASPSSISEGHSSSLATLETVYPTLASSCSVACSVTLADYSVAVHLPGSTVTTAVPFSTSSVNASINAVVHSAEQTIAGDTLTCPVCFKKFAASASNVLWCHINTDHISRCCFPPADFFTLHNRLICSVGACCWASHSCFRHSGCQRKLSTGSRCRGAFVETSTIVDLLSASHFPENDVQHEAMESSHISSHVPDVSFTQSELISIAIEATETLHLSDEYLSFESQLVNSILNSIRNILAVTVTHIPCSIRPLFSQVLCSVLKAATQSIWGFVQLAFSKGCFTCSSPSLTLQA